MLASAALIRDISHALEGDRLKQDINELDFDARYPEIPRSHVKYVESIYSHMQSIEGRG